MKCDFTYCARMRRRRCTQNNHSLAHFPPAALYLRQAMRHARPARESPCQVRSWGVGSQAAASESAAPRSSFSPLSASSDGSLNDGTLLQVGEPARACGAERRDVGASSSETCRPLSLSGIQLEGKKVGSRRTRHGESATAGLSFTSSSGYLQVTRARVASTTYALTLFTNGKVSGPRTIVGNASDPL